jgi:hypothetical protein
MMTFVLAAAVIVGALCIAAALDGATTDAPPVAQCTAMASPGQQEWFCAHCVFHLFGRQCGY